MTANPSTPTNKTENSEKIQKLLVNLLPQEILIERRQSSKLALVNKLSILTLLILVFFTSATLGLRFTQNQELKLNQTNLARAENRVRGLKDKETSIVALKQRLTSIQGLIGGDNKIKGIFNLVIFLTPEDVQITEATVDKNGSMSLSMTTPSLQSLETLIDNLGTKEKNSGMISKVDMDGLSLGKDGLYRFSLKVISSK